MSMNAIHFSGAYKIPNQVELMYVPIMARLVREKNLEPLGAQAVYSFKYKTNLLLTDDKNGKQLSQYKTLYRRFETAANKEKTLENVQATDIAWNNVVAANNNFAEHLNGQFVWENKTLRLDLNV